MFDFIKYKDLENIVHLESDTMLYIDLKELLPLFKDLGTQVAAPFQSTAGCIPCFVFIKADLPFAEVVKSHYNDLGFNFLRSETSFFLVSAKAPLQGIASGRVTPAFSNNSIAIERGCGIF